MIDLQEIGPVGFGAYRVSVRSKAHRKALNLALENGCNLIDTSANYTDGESEQLIGEVLKQRPQKLPFIISKAGYIQGKNIDRLHELQAKGKAKEDLVEVSPDLKHSIHPDFLADQLQNSLKNLQIDCLDGYLLHNPEYFFETNNDQDLYYSRIKKAFEFLEEKVAEGKIRYYGISSNNFPLEPTHTKATSLEKVLAKANEVSSDHHFRLVQFPYNFLETGASQSFQNGATLIEICQKNGLKSFANRPLNAFASSGLLRLATYPIQLLTKEDISDIYQVCLKQIQKKFAQENENPEEVEKIPFLKQFKDIWMTLPTTDAVDQVFFGHLFPFLAKVWGGHVPADDSRPFYILHETATQLARQSMTSKACAFRKDLEKQAIITSDDSRSMSQIAVTTYLDRGIDHVLVGMRRTDYVKDMAPLLKK